MTNSTLNIRPATLADLPQILPLYQSLATPDDSPWPPGGAEAMFTRLSNNPDVCIYVAEDTNQNRIVGTFMLFILRTLAHPGRASAVVEDVAVDPDCQGQGIGKQMMAFAIEECRKHGCYKMALSSNVKRTGAHKFYESLGFERHGYSFVIDTPQPAPLT